MVYVDHFEILGCTLKVIFQVCTALIQQDGISAVIISVYYGQIIRQISINFIELVNQRYSVVVNYYSMLLETDD